MVVVLFFIQPISENLNNLKFNSKYIKKVKIIKRDGFGVRPNTKGLLTRFHQFCWLEKNCYFYDYDLNLKLTKFNYKILKK